MNIRLILFLFSVTQFTANVYPVFLNSSNLFHSGQEKKQADSVYSDVKILRQWLEEKKYNDIIVKLKKKYKKSSCSPYEYKIYAAARIQAYQDLFITRKRIDRLFGDHYYHAKHSIERVLKQNKNDIEAKYLQGFFHKINREFKEAEPFFKEAIVQDSCFDKYTLSDPYRELADIYRQQERWTELDALYSLQLISDSANGWLRIEKAIAAAESESGEDYYQGYMQGLNLLTDSAKFNALFNDYRIIATGFECSEWDTLETIQQKKDFLEAFWKKRDENPLEEGNLFFREFYRRLGYARSWYPKKVYPYYDDRGVIYIRLGKPDYIFVYPADIDIKENHSWIYFNLEGGMHFDFVSNWQYFELRPLSHAIIKTDPYSPPPASLYHARSNIDPFYQKISSRLSAQKEMLKNYQAQIQLMETAEYLDKNNIESNSKKMFMERLSRIPALNMHSRTAYFRESRDSVRQDFFFVIPFQNLIFHTTEIDSFLHESEVKCKSALLDMTTQNVIKTDEKKFVISVLPKQTKKRFFFHEIRLTALPGRYRFITQITNNENDKINFIDRIVKFPSYSLDSLEISDIQLGIPESDQTDIDRFIKPHSNIRLIPYPLSTWNRQLPLTVYYEVYNLMFDHDHRTDYEITYELKASEYSMSLFRKMKSWFSRSNESPFIRVVTGNQTGSRTERETITFDVQTLPKGFYRFTINVLDKISGQSNFKSIEVELQ